MKVEERKAIPARDEKRKTFSTVPPVISRHWDSGVVEFGTRWEINESSVDHRRSYAKDFN